MTAFSIPTKFGAVSGLPFRGWFGLRKLITIAATICFVCNSINEHGTLVSTEDLVGAAASTKDNEVPEERFLVAFNAIGEKNHLPLVEHARRNIFKPDKWDCIAFTFATEDFLPAFDTYMLALEHVHDCRIIRMPRLAWGDFLQILDPMLMAQYDYVAVVLDDVFIPDHQPYLVSTDTLIGNMKKYDIEVISPGVVGESHGQLERAQQKGLSSCLVEVDFVETFVQIFSKKAWACYYQMLHHTGSRGWFYDFKFKDYCPQIKMAQDFSMHAYHMGRGVQEIPKEYDITGTDLVNWKPAGQVKRYGYRKIDGFSICKFSGWKCDRKTDFPGKFRMRTITCPNLEENSPSLL